jgi:hypothetical protein
LFLFVTLVVASNTIAYVVLNNKFVHEWMHKEINERIFQQHDLIFSIDTVSLNFLETQLTLRGVKIQNLKSESTPLLSVGTLSVGFDPWNRLGNWIPRMRYVSASDWKFDLQLMKHFSGDQNRDTAEVIDVEKILESMRPYVGQQIDFKNGNIFDSKRASGNLDINLDSLFFKYNSSAAKDGVTLVLDAQKSRICKGAEKICEMEVQFDHLIVNLTHLPQRPWRIERFETTGPYGSWNARGEITLEPTLHVSQYSFNLQGSADASPWFRLAGLVGSGHFNSNVKIANEVVSEKVLKRFPAPVVEGKVSWKGLRLSGFDIYTGETDLVYASETIRYRNAVLTTPAGARLEAHGVYELSGKMSYKNSAKIRQFPFTELMAGLDVPTNAMDFMMDTDDLQVTGELNPEKKRGFVLLVEGLVAASRLRTPSFEPNKRRLPACNVNLRLETDTRAMHFEGSSAVCVGNDGEFSTRVLLQRGVLDYMTSKNEFRFVVSDGNAAAISYFVDEDISGTFDLRGSILSAPKIPVTFAADVQLNEGKIITLAANRISGHIELSTSGLKATAVEAWFDEDAQTPNVTLNNFNFGFKDRSLNLEGSLSGKISDLLALLGEEKRDAFGPSEGTLRVSKIHLAGKTDRLSQGLLQAEVQVKDLSSKILKARDLRASISCHQGWCSGSRIFAHDVALGQASLKRPKNGEARRDALFDSTAIVEFDSLSDRALSLRADLQSVPFEWGAGGKKAVSGSLDFRGGIQGGWKDWELSSMARVDGLSLFEVPLGGMLINATSHGGGAVNLVASGLFDQIQARLIFDHQLQKSTQLYINMRSFEIFKYLSIFSNTAVRPGGAVTGEFSIDGPGLKNLMQGKEELYKALSGDGVVQKFQCETGGESFALERPVLVDLKSGLVKFTPVTIKGRTGGLVGRGQFDLRNSHFSSQIDGQLDAVLLTQWMSGLSQASGNIIVNANLDVSQEGSRVRGEARAENVFLSGQYLTPPVTSLNGRVVFQDSKIEIPSLTASKGSGQLDLIGTIDLQPDEALTISEQDPSIALRANIRSAMFRWPQPLFDTVETNLDGQIELVGKSRPYLLNGEVKILKGRAYRDATCQELLSVNVGGASDKSIVAVQRPFAQLNLSLDADNSFTLQTTCIRGRVSSSLKFSGTDVEPVIGGQVRLDNGQLNLLKTRFDVTRADAVFDNMVRMEPRLDAQMVAKIEKYSVFVGAEGPLSRPRLNIWSDPSTGPDGTPLSRPTLIRMISTNRGPGETTQTAVTQALANGVVGFFDDPLSQAVSKITRGFVDRFELQPILESGQSSWRARVSRDLGEKFNLGLDLEPNSQSLTGELFINESVNVLGGFDRRSSQIGTYSELKGGFRFQFGGK